MVTFCVAVAVLPCPSFAVQVTTVVPGRKVAGALLVNVTVPQLSLPVGVPNPTVVAARLQIDIAAGAVMVGAMLSNIITVWFCVDVFPLPSVYVQWIVYVPCVL